LLRVLEERRVTPLGANKSQPIDVRLLCATNTAIYEQVDAGKFRPDLLYRINTVEIHLPPLKERGEDIILLADLFMERYGRKYQKPQLKLTRSARAKLLAYHWPGNVRELRHAIERAMIMCEGDTIDIVDFSFPRDAGLPAAPPSENLDQMEKETIRRVLAQCDGNISQAAKTLGLTRATLYRRLQKHGL
jgi:DNA-binding NtrC family response regulator